MPLIRLQTNVHLKPADKQRLLENLSPKAAEWLDKPEAVVQIILENTVDISFAGLTDPSAMVEVRSLGFFGHSTTEITQSLCTFLKEELSIPEDRIFINFFDLERKHWGWNGKTFG